MVTVRIFIHSRFVLLKLHFSDEGVINKKTWLAFLSELEEKS